MNRYQTFSGVERAARSSFSSCVNTLASKRSRDQEQPKMLVDILSTISMITILQLWYISMISFLPQQQRRKIGSRDPISYLVQKMGKQQACCCMSYCYNSLSGVVWWRAVLYAFLAIPRSLSTAIWLLFSNKTVWVIRLYCHQEFEFLIGVSASIRRDTANTGNSSIALVFRTDSIIQQNFRLHSWSWCVAVQYKPGCQLLSEPLASSSVFWIHSSQTVVKRFKFTGCNTVT